MSGIIQPQIAYRLVKELKSQIKIPITLHTHDTAGLGAASYLAAIEAGVDCVEVSIVPFANGTSQPDTQRMLALLEGHPRCPSFDSAKLARLREHFEAVYQQLEKFTSPANERVDSDILIYQVPGGMLSNFRTQLNEQGMADKFDEVVKEIPVVREALGWVPLVTPTSQIVGTQAMMNVKFGRWKMICQPAQDIALGKYGRTPGPINPQVLAQVEKQTGKKSVTERPADLLAPAGRLPETVRRTRAADRRRKQCAVCHVPPAVEALHKAPRPTRRRRRRRPPRSRQAGGCPCGTTGGGGQRIVRDDQRQTP